MYVGCLPRGRAQEGSIAMFCIFVFCLFARVKVDKDMVKATTLHLRSLSGWH